MKYVVLAQWYNVNNRKEHGYCLEGVHTGRLYFESRTKEECLDYAKSNDMKISYEA